jgi:hypothetical protein
MNSISFFFHYSLPLWTFLHVTPPHIKHTSNHFTATTSTPPSHILTFKDVYLPSTQDINMDSVRYWWRKKVHSATTSPDLIHRNPLGNVVTPANIPNFTIPIPVVEIQTSPVQNNDAVGESMGVEVFVRKFPCQTLKISKVSLVVMGS